MLKNGGCPRDILTFTMVPKNSEHSFIPQEGENLALVSIKYLGK